MAQKRMFDRAIIDTDRFMDMPISAKALYFLMGMEADDEGFVSPKKILRLHGGSEDDVKVLIGKMFLIPFESGVVVITDWNKNNWLDNRRIRTTEYKKEKDLLSLTNDKSYVLSTRLASTRLEEKSIEEKSIEEKGVYGEFENVSLSKTELEKLKSRYGTGTTKKLIEELSGYIDSTGTKYKKHYSTLLNWARRKGVEEITHSVKKAEDVKLTPEQIEENKKRIAKISAGLTSKFKMK